MRIASIIFVGALLIAFSGRATANKNRIAQWKSVIDRTGHASSEFTLVGVHGDYSHWSDGQKALIVYANENVGQSAFQKEREVGRIANGPEFQLIFNQGGLTVLPNRDILMNLKAANGSSHRDGVIQSRNHERQRKLSTLLPLLQDPEAPQEVKDVVGAVLLGSYAQSSLLFSSDLDIPAIRKAFAKGGLDALPVVQRYLEKRAHHVLAKALRPWRPELVTPFDEQAVIDKILADVSPQAVLVGYLHPKKLLRYLSAVDALREKRPPPKHLPLAAVTDLLAIESSILYPMSFGAMKKVFGSSSSTTMRLKRLRSVGLVQSSTLPEGYTGYPGYEATTLGRALLEGRTGKEAPALLEAIKSIGHRTEAIQFLKYLSEQEVSPSFTDIKKYSRWRNSSSIALFLNEMPTLIGQKSGGYFVTSLGERLLAVHDAVVSRDAQALATAWQDK